MEIEVKFYRIHDLDIVGLRDMGYPIQAMLKKALIGYANLSPVRFLITEANAISFSDVKSFRVKIRTDDEATIKLLKNIRKRHRNAFCKAVLRDSLMHQALFPYYVTDSTSDMEKASIDDALKGFANVYMIDKDIIHARTLTLKKLAVNSIVNPNSETDKKISEICNSMEAFTQKLPANESRAENPTKIKNREVAISDKHNAAHKKENLGENNANAEHGFKSNTNDLVTASNSKSENIRTDNVDANINTGENANNGLSMPDNAVVEQRDIAASTDNAAITNENITNFIDDKDTSNLSESNVDNNPYISDNDDISDIDEEELMDMFDKLIND